ncbi:RNase H domain-containing protein [Trichonephila clavipes]|nr:RNase H domain-containing protein [Trichonephila clavipes]
MPRIGLPIVLPEEFTADDDSMYTDPIMAYKYSFEFVQSSKNINDADYDDENEIDNAVSVHTLFKMRNLYKWFIVGYKTGISILHKLKHTSLHHNIRFQWISSHVEPYGNEMADKLEKEDCNLPTPSTSAVIYLEFYSFIKKSQNLVEWRIPSTHHWYAGIRLGPTLALKWTDAPRLHSLVLPVIT